MNDTIKSISVHNKLTTDVTASVDADGPPPIQEHDVPVILLNVLMGIACLGVFFNVVVLWVWTSPLRMFVPTNYLFKTVAVADILYMTFFLLLHKPIRKKRRFDFLRDLLARGNCKFGLMVRLILAVARAIRIFFPDQSMLLLSKLRIRLAVFGAMAFCLGQQGTLSAYHLVLPHSNETDILWVVIVDKWVGYIAPSSLQIAVMLVLLWKLWQTSAKTATTAIDMATGSMSTSGTSPENSLTIQKTRRVSYVIAAMCAMSAAAYQIPALLEFEFSIDSSLVGRYGTAEFVGNIFGFVNSSVNIFFYLMISRFRVTLKKKMRHLLIILCTWSSCLS